MFKNSFLILTLIILSSKIHAQYEIKGIVKAVDSLEPLPYATIQLLDLKSSKTIKYTSTDANGFFSLQIEKPNIYLLKTSYIGYVSLFDTIAIDRPVLSLNMVLKKDINALDEVVLKYDPRVMQIDNDTITYDLKKLTTGEEKTLANIIDKLPGVKLNNSGQLIANGKLVKKLLIDGEELFKKPTSDYYRKYYCKNG